jgi:uncharacterized membrane protein (DUF4010 family)
LVAAGLGTVLASLLAARNRMHHFVRTTLTEHELYDIILLFTDALKLIAMVMAISACCYVALLILGPRFGLPLAGFASGFVSSTATVHSKGRGLASIRWRWAVRRQVMRCSPWPPPYK